MSVQVTNADEGMSAVAVAVTAVALNYTQGSELVPFVVSFGDRPLDVSEEMARSVGSDTTEIITRIAGPGSILADLSVGGANMVPDSSFENASSSAWSVGSQWVKGHASAAPFHGSKTARLAPTGTATGELVLSTAIAIDRTDDWWISFWSNLSAYTTGTARCQVREYDSGDALLATTDVNLAAADTAWTRWSLHFGPNDVNRIPFQATTTGLRLAFYAVTTPTLVWEVERHPGRTRQAPDCLCADAG